MPAIPPAATPVAGRIRLPTPTPTPPGPSPTIAPRATPIPLAGAENLEYLRYRGLLDYLDFSHLPALRRIELKELVENLPDNFSPTGLPKPERFSGEFRGPASDAALIDNYGPDPRKTFRDIYGDPDTADAELAGYCAKQIQPRLGNQIEITAGINLSACE